MARRRVRIEPGVSGRRYLSVPEELIELYAPRISWQAVAAWLVLRLAAERGGSVGDNEELTSFVARTLGLSPLEAGEAMRRLTLYRLVEPAGEHALRVLEPLEAASFAREFGEVGAPLRPAPSQPEPAPAAPQEVAAAADPSAGASQPLPADIREVLDWYHQRIGLISESQIERLCEWITQRGMTTDVVALAIEQTARSAEYASFSYLEGVLRNWYNQGVRTWADVLRRPHLASVLNASRAAPPGPPSAPGAGGGSPSTPAGQGAPVGAGPGSGAGKADRSDAPMVGVPNAEAYRPVDPERVKRIKELYGYGR